MRTGGWLGCIPRSSSLVAWQVSNDNCTQRTCCTAATYNVPPRGHCCANRWMRHMTPTLQPRFHHPFRSTLDTPRPSPHCEHNETLCPVLHPSPSSYLNTTLPSGAPGLPRGHHRSGGCVNRLRPTPSSPHIAPPSLEEHLVYPEAVAALVDGRITWREDGVPILWAAH